MIHPQSLLMQGYKYVKWIDLNNQCPWSSHKFCATELLSGTLFCLVLKLLSCLKRDRKYIWPHLAAQKQRFSAPMQNDRLDYHLFSLTQFQATLRQVSILDWHHLVPEIQLELWERGRSWHAVFDNSLIIKHFEVWEIGRKILQPPIFG